MAKSANIPRCSPSIRLMQSEIPMFTLKNLKNKGM